MEFETATPHAPDVAASTSRFSARPALAAACVAACSFHAAAQPAPYTIAALPDTQYYCETPSWTFQFNAQTAWIRQQKAARNIVFVSHLGDIVQNGAAGGNLSEWIRADAAIDILDGVLPYSVVIGNHDYETVSNKSSGSATYLSFFGPQRYADKSWYIGHSSSGNNHAQLIQAESRFYLHLGLEWRPDAAVLAWAQSMINLHPAVPTIISTHEHLRDANTDGLNAGRSTAGQLIWDTLVRPNRQVFMVLNGHFHSGPPGIGGEHYLASLNDHGVIVLEMLSDFQGRSQGGQGWMRMLKFDERSGMLRVRTFSPVLRKYEVDASSTLDFAIDFPRRFLDPGDSPPALRELAFRQGESGYSLCSDTTLKFAAPDVAHGGEISLSVDSSDGAPAGPNHTLLRFDGLFGSGAGQIGVDSDVVLAKLRLFVNNPGSSLRVHRMLAAWNEQATWNARLDGVSADGAEATAAPDAVAGLDDANSNVPYGWIELDVTPSLRAWKNGAPIQGWSILPSPEGTNGVVFPSSEGVAGERPTLVVVAPARPVAIRSFREGEAGYTGALDVGIRQSAPDAPDATAASLTIGSDDPAGTGRDSHALLRFDNLFAPGAVPLDTMITSAVLVLNADDDGSGFAVHRMLRPWTGSSTWNSMAGGVAADDFDAAIYPEAVAGADGPSASVKRGTLWLDVTETVQAWQAGAPNHGWVLRQHVLGTDSLTLHTSEAEFAPLRPKLVVRFVVPPCAADFNGDDQADFFDYLDFAAAFDSDDPRADINGDRQVDFFDYLDFVAAFDRGCVE